MAIGRRALVVAGAAFAGTSSASRRPMLAKLMEPTMVIPNILISSVDVSETPPKDTAIAVRMLTMMRPKATAEAHFAKR